MNTVHMEKRGGEQQAQDSRLSHTNPGLWPSLSLVIFIDSSRTFLKMYRYGVCVCLCVCMWVCTNGV